MNIRHQVHLTSPILSFPFSTSLSSSQKSLEMDSFTAITLFFNNSEVETQVPSEHESGNGSGGVRVINHSEVAAEINDEDKGSGSGGVCVIA